VHWHKSIDRAFGAFVDCLVLALVEKSLQDVHVLVALQASLTSVNVCRSTT
jgi:hypothetical protein